MVLLCERWVGDWAKLQHMVIIVFLSCSPGLLNRGPRGPAFLGAGFLYRILSPTATAQSGAWGPTLLGTGFLCCFLSPTDWTSCALSYIIVWRPPSSCGRDKSHSFNPSVVKVIFWYFSTGCTCYLHRCISYLSEVNIQQSFTGELLLGVCRCFPRSTQHVLLILIG